MAYSKRDYLNLHEKMDLYILLQAQDAIKNIAKWPWLDGKTRGYLKAFNTRFDNHYPEFVKMLPENTVESMESFKDGYMVEFKTKIYRPADNAITNRKDDIAELLSMLIDDRCVGCQMNAKEAKTCTIRRVQARMMNCKEPASSQYCEYRYEERDGLSD